MGLFSRSREPKIEVLDSPFSLPGFDKKYKSILILKSTYRDIEYIDWLGDNTSDRSVDVKWTCDGNMHIAFIDVADMLIFKIKFL